MTAIIVSGFVVFVVVMILYLALQEAQREVDDAQRLRTRDRDNFLDSMNRWDVERAHLRTELESWKARNLNQEINALEWEARNARAEVERLRETLKGVAECLVTGECYLCRANARAALENP